MIPGTSFQPGGYDSSDPRSKNGGQSAVGGAPEGVQQAIKVLSLRLPKVVGAQAVSPQGLLQSQGSGGHPNVDSIVESVLSRMFGQQRQGATAPMIPQMEQAPNPQQPQQAQVFGGQRQGDAGLTTKLSPFPRVIVDTPSIEAPYVGGAPRRPNTPMPEPSLGPDLPLGMIAPLPPNFTVPKPDAPSLMPDLGWAPPYEPPPLI